nr:MAG TPA: hypothetical protein [Caudoviricetes sp.]
MKLLKDQTENVIINTDAIAIIYTKPEGVPTTSGSQKYVLCCDLIRDTQPVHLLTSDYDSIKYHQRKLELALISTGDNEIIEISEL